MFQFVSLTFSRNDMNFYIIFNITKNFFVPNILV